jgi:tRNA (guanine-N7-)-methyltransferase
MKPKNLKCPFVWKDRRPLIESRILYVPSHYDLHQEWVFPGWDSPEIFGRSGPIEIEYCTGNGDWIIERALAHPDRNWIAVERQFERVRKIWSKMHNFSLSNLFIVCGEAQTFTCFYVPDQSFNAVYINFPDPWPKARHAKKRLLQEPFIREMGRVSVPEATMTIVTDHSSSASQICQTMAKNRNWDSYFPSPYFVTEWKDYGTSYFDSLWREKGLTIHYMRYVLKKDGKS